VTQGKWSVSRSVGRYRRSPNRPVQAPGLVPAARLVILAATSHIGIVAASAVLVPMVSAFLDDVPPATPDLF
jgi:hypothetical protein